MASTNDYFKKTGSSTVTTLSAPGKALGATSLTVGSTTNYPSDTGIIVAIRVVDTAGELVAGTYTEWSATVSSGTSLAIVATPVYGSDQVYAAGSTTQVYIPLSSYAHNKVVDGVLSQHKQTGEHADTITTNTINENTAANGVTIDGLNIKDGALNTANSVPNSALAGGITISKLTNPYKARAYATVDQTINDNSQTTVNFGSETYDINSNFASNQYTAPVTGYYQFNAQVWVQDNEQKLANATLLLLVNGATILQTVSHPSNTNTLTKYCPQFSDILYLTAGQVIKIDVFGDTTDSGTYLVAGGSTLTWFSIHLLSV